MLYALGSPDGGRLASSYLGALFLGGFLLAIGQFLSLLSKDQIVAYLTTLLAGAVALLSGHELLAGVLDGLSPRLQAGTWLRETVSALPHYESFTRGLVELRSTVYFGLLAAVFLYLSLRVIEAHKE
jgi:ABC-2 type transport system permease protein